LREDVRSLHNEGQDPFAIAKAVRELPPVKKALEFAREKKSPVNYDRTLVAAFTLGEWLPVPELTRREILNELFHRKRMKSTLTRSKETIPEILLAADWIRRSAARTVAPTTKMFTTIKKHRRFKWLFLADGFPYPRVPYGYRRTSKEDSPLNWSVSDLGQRLREEVRESPSLERELRHLEARYDPDHGLRVRKGALWIIDGMARDTARVRAEVQMTPTGWMMLLRNPILCGLLDDKNGGLPLLKTDTSILSGVEFVALQTRLALPLSQRAIVGHREDELESLCAAAIQKLTGENRMSTPKTIAEEAGLTHDQVWKILPRMAGHGSIIRISRTPTNRGIIVIYGLPKDEAPESPNHVDRVPLSSSKDESSTELVSLL
jgi:hypothetical protein